MKAFELYTKDGKQTGVFCCGQCRIVHRTQQEAENCCVCQDCKKNIVQRYNRLCDICSNKRLEKQDKLHKEKVARILSKATETTQWEYIYYNDIMYSDIDTLIDDCDGIENAPQFVHAMKPVKFEGFNPSLLLENYIEGAFADFDMDDLTAALKGYDILESAIKEFNMTNKDTIVWWIEDESKKVRIKD